MITDYAAKVSALLAKAESTTFPEEAEALMAKAQELMKLHAISDAMLEASGAKAKGEIIERSVRVPKPYSPAKVALLTKVARANGCQCIRLGVKSKKDETVSLIGYASDVGAVENLFTTLLMHATRIMLATKTPPYDTTLSFRNSFLLGFSRRIGERLEEANRAATAEAEEEHGQSVALVMVERDKLVASDFRHRYPHVRTTHTRSNGAGGEHGARAADRANLGQRNIGGAGRAIGAGR